MAIYHFSGQVISRSQGRSSVAASAYRSGEKLLDERTGLMHDYGKKSDVLEKAMLLPKKAPERFLDREVLWNEVERVENRKDAQLAREFNMALPRELTHEQNWDLAKAYVQREFVDVGMIADMAMHSGHKGQEEQPHIHVMLSLREVDSEGFGKKARGWNDKALLQHWRESWAEHVNRELVKHGYDQRIDHRTLEAQGIDLEPQSKIGPKAAWKDCIRFEEHQEISHRNGERLLENPSIALDAITRQQSTFTHQDVAKFVNRHTSSKEQFEQVYEKIRGHESVVLLGVDSNGIERHTTQSMLAMEQAMIGRVSKIAQSPSHDTSHSRVDSAINGRSLSSEQKEMLRHITIGSDIACVVGVAGTGKSYTLDAAREAWEAEGFKVKGMTLSGKAAEELEASSGVESRTVASFEHYWDKDQDFLTDKDIVVVDEAGMLGSRQMGRIMEEVERAHAKVVLVGDPEQLQAIDAGAAFRAISERVGFAQLSEVRRQQVDWQKQATKDFAKAETERGLAAYDAHDSVHAFETKEAAKSAMVDRWQEARSSEPDKTDLMLAYTRQDVRDLNEHARRIRDSNGELGKRDTFEVHHLTEKNGEMVVERSLREFAENDKIYFLKNDRELGVKNGTLGTIMGIEGDKLLVTIDRSNCPIKVNTQFYKHLDHGYATTVHKSQAGTYDRTHVLASKYFDRHTTYVAMSRHRLSAEVYWSQDVFSDRKEMMGVMSREQLKDTTLDYERDYAERRGFEKPSISINKDQLLSKALTPGTFPELSEEMNDRLQRAEDRLKDRAFQGALSRIEKNLGLSLDTEIKVGDKGVYKQMVEIEGKRYGVMAIGEGKGKLIPKDMMESRRPEKKMEIQSKVDRQGHSQLKAIQDYGKERGIEREYEGMSR